MISKFGFLPFPNVFDLSIVNKSCGHENAVISKNSIKSGIVAAYRRLVNFDFGWRKLTFCKVLQKWKQVQKFCAENTDEKLVKMTKKLGF